MPQLVCLIFPQILTSNHLLATLDNYAKEVLEEHKAEEGVEDAIRNLGVLSVTSPKDDMILPSTTPSTVSYHLRSYHDVSRDEYAHGFTEICLANYVNSEIAAVMRKTKQIR